MAKNKITSEGSSLKEVFCTECNASLENYCFSEGVDNPEAIKKTLAQCKKTGKFAGEFCAKLFISNPEMLDSLWEKDRQE